MKALIINYDQDFIHNLNSCPLNIHTYKHQYLNWKQITIFELNISQLKVCSFFPAIILLVSLIQLVRKL